MRQRSAILAFLLAVACALPLHPQDAGEAELLPPSSRGIEQVRHGRADLAALRAALAEGLSALKPGEGVRLVEVRLHVPASPGMGAADPDILARAELTGPAWRVVFERASGSGGAASQAAIDALLTALGCPRREDLGRVLFPQSIVQERALPTDLVRTVPARPWTLLEWGVELLADDSATGWRPAAAALTAAVDRADAAHAALVAAHAIAAAAVQGFEILAGDGAAPDRPAAPEAFRLRQHRLDRSLGALQEGPSRRADAHLDRAHAELRAAAQHLRRARGLARQVESQEEYNPTGNRRAGAHDVERLRDAVRQLELTGVGGPVLDDLKRRLRDLERQIAQGRAPGSSPDPGARSRGQAEEAIRAVENQLDLRMRGVAHAQSRGSAAAAGLSAWLRMVPAIPEGPDRCAVRSALPCWARHVRREHERLEREASDLRQVRRRCAALAAALQALAGTPGRGLRMASDLRPALLGWPAGPAGGEEWHAILWRPAAEGAGGARPVAWIGSSGWIVRPSHDVGSLSLPRELWRVARDPLVGSSLRATRVRLYGARVVLETGVEVVPEEPGAPAEWTESMSARAAAIWVGRAAAAAATRSEVHARSHLSRAWEAALTGEWALSRLAESAAKAVAGAVEAARAARAQPTADRGTVDPAGSSASTRRAAALCARLREAAGAVADADGAGAWVARACDAAAARAASSRTAVVGIEDAGDREALEAAELALAWAERAERDERRARFALDVVQDAARRAARAFAAAAEPGSYGAELDPSILRAAVGPAEAEVGAGPGAQPGDASPQTMTSWRDAILAATERIELLAESAGAGGSAASSPVAARADAVAAEIEWFGRSARAALARVAIGMRSRAAVKFAAWSRAETERTAAGAVLIEAATRASGAPLHVGAAPAATTADGLEALRGLSLPELAERVASLEEEAARAAAEASAASERAARAEETALAVLARRRAHAISATCLDATTAWKGSLDLHCAMRDSRPADPVRAESDPGHAPVGPLEREVTESGGGAVAAAEGAQRRREREADSIGRPVDADGSHGDPWFRARLARDRAVAAWVRAHGLDVERGRVFSVLKERTGTAARPPGASADLPANRRAALLALGAEDRLEEWIAGLSAVTPERAAEPAYVRWALRARAELEEAAMDGIFATEAAACSGDAVDRTRAARMLSRIAAALDGAPAARAARARLQLQWAAEFGVPAAGMAVPEAGASGGENSGAESEGTAPGMGADWERLAVESERSIAETLAREARTLDASGDGSGALRAWRELLVRHPAVADAARARTAIDALLRRAEVRAALDAAARAAVEEAAAAERTGRFDEAQRRYQRVVEEFPDAGAATSARAARNRLIGER